MPTDHRARLASIKRFDQLIAYLRDEMGWPIDNGSDFEDLTFEYTPEELGIDAKNAAKIQEIKRLRPLSPRQPWGIFFVKFEPKRLPIVALRRILGQVALKKRASANSAERAAWAADDLLFVSNYGEGDERKITFAHFSQAKDSQDLPTLKVLGWDNLDTVLHLDAVARELTEHLAWPDDDADAEAWRTRWRAAFTLGHREVVATSKELSIRLAALARDIRDRIKAALAIETDKGLLTRLMKAFQEALVHDLDADGFADMYSQTIAYGLLSARIADPQKKTADDFPAHLRTNPFLRELMETFLKAGGRRGKAGGPGIDFDELGISEVVELLDDANMEAVVRDFGDRRPDEDPVTHFYELFLNEFDQEEKKRRGVFYTPRPVVSYIVRSVDELLRTTFGLADGLADTTTWKQMSERDGLKVPKGVSPDTSFVQLLDPATGTGTFLVEVIDLIHHTVVTKWKTQGHSPHQIVELWNDYVPKQLLPRLHGYELLMAPYAIAHLKISLKLYETGYRFANGERVRVYLTNALEPAQDFSDRFAFTAPALATEARSVNMIKESARFTVVVGNPPYANFGRQNKHNFILELLEDYKCGLRERKLNLDDDFIKFIRLAQWHIDTTGYGLIGMITSSTFLDGVNHRRMRELLTLSFPVLFLLNLHGNAKRRETPPSGAANDNVFDIMQGVSVSLMAKPLPLSGARKQVSYYDAWGTRAEKYHLLGRSTCHIDGSRLLSPVPDRFFLVDKDLSNATEYERWPNLRAILPLHSLGIETSRDAFAVSLDMTQLRDRIRRLRSSVPDLELRAEYGLDDKRDWQLAEARRVLRAERNPQSLIKHVLYRPFDERHIIYSDAIVTWPRHEVLDNLLDGKNVALICVRNSREESNRNFYCTKYLTDKAVLSSRDNATVFPLFRRDPADSESLFSSSTEGLYPNLSTDFVGQLRSRLGEQGVSERLGPVLWPAEIFHYIYAILHSPAYRSRYGELLKIDFPHIPLPGSSALFRSLVNLGGEVVRLHLFEAPQPDRYITTYLGGPDPVVERISWSRGTVWLDKAQTVGFKAVPEHVWNFQMGGYQVCEKWLKDRKGRTLSMDDIAHYQKVVVALSETIRLMAEIDEVIEQHGGWPDAFASAGADGPAPLSAGVEEELDWAGAEAQSTLFQSEQIPFRRVAEPVAGGYGAQPASEAADDPSQPWDLDEAVCSLRQLFSDGEDRTAAAAVAEVQALDAETSSGNQKQWEAALQEAVRRGVLEEDGGLLRLAARNVDQYERDWLKEQFLASLGGCSWVERENAVRGFARWLGFRRTGSKIKAAGKSLINGLIRDGRLEADGDSLRPTR